MLGFFQAVQVISGALLILLILLHSPKGAGLAAIGDAAQLFSSQRSVEAGLNKFTAIISTIFIVSSILLGFGIIR
ncbi:MAG: preprotein translocase subunit SecG [Candidatus Melainabacteria bacterium RIFOXYA12_FULL_32_12]|nr:MAG: preprotein translocase subunit SecG [Candidatus Melainabacteria bacterium GWF2_32_7]OGI16577.1 MAG: preprotein translocase subunit SecG [Candidatus Melainabacteria bacterium RIFOXYA2_FULL_32_9]OGI29049.1 MAG: preprotein translocase subunit SecG [Candidatus Melainabacteria bacterium RIFOXYA12_FULL_32_12]